MLTPSKNVLSNPTGSLNRVANPFQRLANQQRGARKNKHFPGDPQQLHQAGDPPPAGGRTSTGPGQGAASDRLF